jgi:hypothetical protein
MTPNQSHLLRIFFWLMLAVILAGLAALADGQTVPAGRQFPRIDWKHAARSGWLEDASVRGLDTWSTHLALSRGARELFLPSAIADHPAVMALYSGSAVALNECLAHQLARRHHAKIARLVPWVDTAQVGFYAVHNFWQHGTPAAKFPSRPLPPRSTN